MSDEQRFDDGEFAGSAPIEDALISAFVALARGDFSVRLPRNFTRDTNDTLAFFINLIAEQLGRLMSERERNHRRVAASVEQLSECFVALAAGDFQVRAERSHSGDPIDVLAFLFNNTASEVGEAFEQLDHQRSTLEAILESMIDGVVLLDHRGVIQRANRALGALLDVDNQQLVGQPLSVLLAAGEREFAERIAEAMADGPFRDRDTLFRSPSGETRSMAVNVSPQRGPHGELLGIVLVARDDRELKQAQAQLQLADRLTTIGTVAAGVAHEINNPLAFVIGNLDFAGEEVAEMREAGEWSAERVEELERALESSRGGAERVRQIVRDLKTFARADQDAQSEIELNKLIDYANSMIRNEVRHHARVVKEYGEVPRVIASEGRLVQVFLNLIQNAAQAIPVGAAADNTIRIVTGAEPKTGAAFVEIHDTGVGIPEQQLSRIFDAFYTTKPAGVGTGIGLAICQKIVTSVGGHIDVESTAGSGSTFRVVLPAADPAASVSSGQEDGARGAAGASPERARLLVIDDEREIGESVARILGRGHEIEIVVSAVAALDRLARGERFDLILTDLLMPHMTGMQLYAEISRDYPAMVERMAFMTGGSFSPDAQEFLESVDNPRLEKPFNTRTLRAFVGELLAAGSGQQAGQS